MSERYDLLIQNATIVDGTGRPAYAGSLALRGERIAAIGEFPAEAAETIDAAGRIVCPGFIDPHDHADITLLEQPLVENLLMQGVTTFVGGNCGYSAGGGMSEESTPRNRSFGQWLEAVEAGGIGPNYVPLVGHNTLRWIFMHGPEYRRPASPSELSALEEAVHEAMHAGAFGFTTGLDAFHPAHFAEVDEIVRLAQIAGEHGGIFSPHTRHHQNQWPAESPTQFGYGVFHAPKGELIAGRYHGLLEAVEISRAANVPLHIAHLTPAYIVPQPHPAFLDEALARATLADIIDAPRAAGQTVSFNVLGWDQSIGAAVPLLDSLFDARQPLPDWFINMPRHELPCRLTQRAFREQVKDLFLSGRFKFGMLHPLTDPYWMDCYQILRCKEPGYAGKTIGEIARARRPSRIIEAVYDAAFEVVFDALVADPQTVWGLIIDKREHGALATFLQHEAGMPCTDVFALPARPGQVWDVPPIAYGMYPHYFRTLVKEERALSLEQAVHKATALPASVFGISDRGVLRAGAYADIVLLDWEALREDNSMLEPARPPLGIERVIVNGVTAYAAGQATGARAGKVLRKG